MQNPNWKKDFFFFFSGFPSLSERELERDGEDRLGEELTEI